MNEHRYPDRLIHHFVLEGSERLHDRVYDAVRAEIERRPQRIVIGPWRMPTLNKLVPIGLGAAAVVVALVVGTRLLGPPAPAGVGGAPSAEPSASQLTGPMALVDSPTPDNLPPGEYFIDLPAYPARIDFELPAGWWHFWDGPDPTDSTVQAILVLDTRGANGSAWGLSYTLVDEVRVDPCDPSAGTMEASVTESVDSLAAAFSSWPVFQATAADVTVGGFPGKRVEISADDAEPCDGVDPVLFSTPTGYGFAPEFPSSEPFVNQFTFLDVDGSVLVIWTTDFSATTLFEVDGGASPDPEAHVSDQVELHDILESIVITPG